MSIYYSQPSGPRKFDYMNNPVPISIENVPTTRRTRDSSRSAISSLDNYMNKGIAFDSKGKINNADLPNTKRTMVPDMNVTSYTIRVFKIIIEREY